MIANEAVESVDMCNFENQIGKGQKGANPEI